MKVQKQRQPGIHLLNCVCVHTKSSHCYYQSFTWYRLQKSNNLNTIRAASRWFQGKYVLLSLIHYERWKITPFFIIMKGSTGHKKSTIKVRITHHNKSTRLSNTMAFKRYLRDWCSGCLFMPVCPLFAVESELTEATQSRSADQQVISISPGRYLKKKHIEMWK